jgi:hypothetical protein
MGQNFISCYRGRVMLLPPSLTDWLLEDHLVWTVIGAVEQMDLGAFYGVCRANGQGRAACDPAMMVALLVYSMRWGCGLRDGLSGRAVGMWRSRSSRRCRLLITRRSRSSVGGARRDR